jgi:DNA repair protein RadC
MAIQTSAIFLPAMRSDVTRDPDSPARRCIVDGPASLGDAELINLLIGQRDGARARSRGGDILDLCGGLRGLVESSVRELSSIPGVGEAMALRIMASMELGRRAATRAADRGEPIRGCCEVHSRLAPRLAPLNREVFMALALDVRGRLISEHCIAQGGMDECRVMPRDVFRPLLRCGAASCILAHNHPSGDPRPSTQDRYLTLRMAEAGRMLGIKVLDHVIVTEGRWYSFREEGVI